MREIKFRYRIEQKGRVTLCIITQETLEGPAYLDGPVISRDQYTGLKDKKGVDAYDKDIYRNLDSGLVGKFEILTGVGSDYVNCTEYKDGEIYNNHAFARHDSTNFEVIGNTYDNPELLKAA